MQEKIWYYEKWVGRQATFSPSRYVKPDHLEVFKSYGHLSKSCQNVQNSDFQSQFPMS